MAASISFTPVQPNVSPTAPRGTVLGIVSVKNEQGVEIPCRFSVDEPVTWFAMNGNKVVSNWNPSVVFPEQGAIPPGAHQIIISDARDAAG
jgi:hypothetical protein